MTSPDNLYDLVRRLNDIIGDLKTQPIDVTVNIIKYVLIEVRAKNAQDYAEKLITSHKDFYQNDTKISNIYRENPNF